MDVQLDHLLDQPVAIVADACTDSDGRTSFEHLRADCCRAIRHLAVGQAVTKRVLGFVGDLSPTCLELLHVGKFWTAGAGVIVVVRLLAGFLREGNGQATGRAVVAEQYVSRSMASLRAQEPGDQQSVGIAHAAVQRQGAAIANQSDNGLTNLGNRICKLLLCSGQGEYRCGSPKARMTTSAA